MKLRNTGFKFTVYFKNLNRFKSFEIIYCHCAEEKQRSRAISNMIIGTQ